jgi:hypothetical protein
VNIHSLEVRVRERLERVRRGFLFCPFLYFKVQKWTEQGIFSVFRP